jgi:hypothetical protein
MVASMAQGQGAPIGPYPDPMMRDVAAVQNQQNAPMPDPNMGAVQGQQNPQAMSGLVASMQPSGPPPMVQGGSPARDPNAPPTMKGRKPNIVNLIQGLMNPAKGTPAGERVASRTDVFENFLGQFMNSFSQGLQASGHGPGANLRAAGAAIQAPYRQDVQEFQQQQQQRQQEASLAQQSAQTQATQVGTQGAELNQQMMRKRLAMMGGTDAQSVIQNLGQLSPDEQAVVQAARLESNMKGDVTPLLTAVEKVTSQRAISGRVGPSAIIENSDSPTGFSKVFYDKTGTKIVQKQDNIPPPPGMIGKTTTSQRLVADKDGNINIVTMTGTSTPNLPGKGQPRPGTPPPQGGTGTRGTSKVIQGQQVLDASGDTLHKPLDQSAKTTIGQINSALSLADRVRPDLEAVAADMGRGGNLADAAKIRAAWAVYQKLGIDPANEDPNSILAKMPNTDPRIARLMPTIAMLQILGAQPYLKNIRRFEFIKQVQQHIPDPEKDTPQLMVEKLRQFDRNLPTILAATYKAEGITPKLDVPMRDRYMRLSGGDVNKARLMARQDGWDISKK